MGTKQNLIISRRAKMGSPFELLAPAGLRWVVLMAIMAVTQNSAASNYLIGLGSYDITGPAADVNMMGYANPSQITAGIHFRLRARAFIVASPDDSSSRFVFVNMDACMAADIITIKVLERLNARYGELYTERNVAISGTHTHSGPGGYLQYVLYIVTSLGFVPQSFNALVQGIEQSIVEAHENLRPGSVFMNIGELLDANINRSPSAYLNNPPEERAKYQYNTDKNMTLLKFVVDEWGGVGAFSWYATHGTSMSRTNRLISGDNKGAAARLMEDSFDTEVGLHGNSSKKDADVSKPPRFKRKSRGLRNSKEPSLKSDESFSSIDGQKNIPRVRNGVLTSSGRPFVAAFCQSNVGDTSPNVLGAFCNDTGLPCDFDHSTCNGKSQLCIGRGPAFPDEFASTIIIGERQFKSAVSLFNSASARITGKIDYRHAYVDFSKVTVILPFTSDEGTKGSTVKTCPAAVGFSFAAGTTDGPGAFRFVQGDMKGNLFWRLVGSTLKNASQEQVDCQMPKPILIDTGEINRPYAWAPDVLPLQILRLGNFIILCVPSEFTTMAGRRLRDSVKATLIAKSNGEFTDDTVIVIAGLTNSYSQYVTTFEEYQQQRYEGASTLYGPHTLSAYIQEFSRLASALAEGTVLDPGPRPPNLLSEQIGFLPGVILDAAPTISPFGSVIEDVSFNAVFKQGDVVSAKFQSADPRNDLFTEKTFALVEMLDNEGNWNPSYDDDDLSLRFLWGRPSPLSPQSFAKIRWEIPNTAAPGTYRLRHFGAAKHLLSDDLDYFSGTSSTFTVE